VPIHIEELSSEVAVVDGGLPLTERQLDRIAAIVLAKLKEQQRTAERRREVQKLRRSVVPPLEVKG
jgi:hypothetical protein